LRYACRVNSITELALTHLDIYDTLDTIEACTAYNIDGTITEDFPASIEKLEKAKPVLQSFTGWKIPLKTCRNYKTLPPHARSYIEYIEQYCGVKVSIVSVGYERQDTFMRNDPFDGKR
jgi:adenylosuccinate synthase